MNYYWDRVDAADNGVYRLDVASRKWQRLNQPGAQPRNLYESTSLVYDSRRDQVILHGGGPRRDELVAIPPGRRPMGAAGSGVCAGRGFEAARLPA